MPNDISGFQVTDIVQSVGIVVTLGIAIWQMRVHNKNMQASAELALMLKFDDINKLLLERPGLWKLLEEDYEAGQSNNELEKIEYIVFIVFNTLELAFRHYSKYELMRNDDWMEWQSCIDSYVKKPYILGWWRVNRLEYGNRFMLYVDTRVSSAIHPENAT